MNKIPSFLNDDTGAVTIDWVALTAGILLLGIMVVYAIFNGGVSALVSSVNSTLTSAKPSADIGDAPDLNNAGGSGSTRDVDQNRDPVSQPTSAT